MKPAARPGLVRRRLVLEIAREESPPGIGAARADQQFAGLSDRNVGAGLVNDSVFQGRGRRAHAALADMTRTLRTRRDPAPAGFRHRPAFDQRKSEPALEHLMMARVDTRPEAKFQAMRAFRRLLVE